MPRPRRCGRCVEEHIACIQAIESELRESSATEPAMIYSAAESIIAANGLVQHQFSDIQQMLDNKQVELHDHVSDPYGLLCTFASLDRQKHIYRQVLGSLELLAVELMTNIAGPRPTAAEHHQRIGVRRARKAAGRGVGSQPDFQCSRRPRTEDRTRPSQQIGQQAEKVQMQAVLSHTDLLTSLPNRRAFEAELEQSVARSRGKASYFSILFLDLDGFGQVNLQYGHQGGDVILRQTASVIKQMMRGKDMVARYAGDTFAHPAAPDDAARCVADRRPNSRRPSKQREFSHGNYPLRLTASVGVAQLQPEETADDVDRRADERAACGEAIGRQRLLLARRADELIRCRRPSGRPTKIRRRAQFAWSRCSAARLPAARRMPRRSRPKTPEEGGQGSRGRSLFVNNLQRRLAEWKRGGPTVSVVVLRVDQLEALAGAIRSRCRKLPASSDGATARGGHARHG